MLNCRFKDFQDPSNQFPPEPDSFKILQGPFGNNSFAYIWSSHKLRIQKQSNTCLDELHRFCFNILIIWYVYIYMSDCENPRFTERTSTNLGRSHRLPHVCTIMIYGKLGGYRLQETAAFIYICDELWIICDIWVSLMWILEKYDDITLKRGIANLGRSHRLPRVFNNFHQFP